MAGEADDDRLGIAAAPRLIPLLRCTAPKMRLDQSATVPSLSPFDAFPKNQAAIDDSI